MNKYVDPFNSFVKQILIQMNHVPGTRSINLVFLFMSVMHYFHYEYLFGKSNQGS